MAKNIRTNISNNTFIYNNNITKVPRKRFWEVAMEFGEEQDRKRREFWDKHFLGVIAAFFFVVALAEWILSQFMSVNYAVIPTIQFVILLVAWIIRISSQSKTIRLISIIIGLLGIILIIPYCMSFVGRFQ